MYPLLKDRYVPTAVKVKIYKTIFRPILTYESESWTLTTTTKSKIQAAEMRVLRLIKGVTRRDRLRNEDIRKEPDVKSILQHVEETQIRWFGHVKRMSDDRTAHQWLQWKPSTTSRPGRPRKRWMDNSKTAVERRGTTLQEVESSGMFLAGRPGDTCSLKGHRPISTAVQGTTVQGTAVHNLPRKCLTINT